MVKCPNCEDGMMSRYVKTRDAFSSYLCPVCKGTKEVPKGTKKMNPNENHDYYLVNS